MRKVIGLLGLIFAGIISIALVHPALAQTSTARIYFEPSAPTFPEETPVGTKFNVTVWTQNFTSIEIGGSQIYLEFNDDIINVTRWWAPDWDADFFMPDPHSALPTPPDDAGYMHLGAGRGRILIAVLKGGLPPVAPWAHDGKICIFEFNITQGPTPGLSSVLKMNTTDTYLLDSEAGEIAGVIMENGTYTIIPEFLPVVALAFFIAAAILTVLITRKASMLRFGIS